MGTRRSRHNKGRKPLYKEHRLGLDSADAIDAGAPMAAPNAFLMCDAVKALTIADVRKLNEPDAKALFRKIRWFDNDGNPYCPRCGSRHFYASYAHREERYRCADCAADYSVTSGTIFSHRKTGYASMLIAMIALLGGDGASVAARLAALSKRGVRETQKKLSSALEEAPYKVTGIDGNNCLPTDVQAQIEKRVREGQPIRLIAGELGISKVTVDGYAAQIRGRLTALPGGFSLDRPRYCNGSYLSTRTWWSEPERQALSAFAQQKAPMDKVALALGRTPTSIAWYARDLLKKDLPREWGALMRPKIGPRIVLAYPYIAKARPENAELLRANDLVPKSFPEWIRADICQSVMLAVYEGQVTLEQLELRQKDVRWFISKFYREQMPRQEITGLSGGDDDDRDTYEIAAAMAHVDWAWEELNGSRHAYDRLRTHAAATQESDADAMLMRERHEAWHQRGVHLSPDEMDEIYHKRDGGVSAAQHQRLLAMKRRDELFHEQHGRCAYCRCEMTLRWGSPNTVTRDHIVAVSAGGSDDDSNLVGACLECNWAKGSLPLAEFVASRRPNISHTLASTTATDRNEP